MEQATNKKREILIESKNIDLMSIYIFPNKK